MPRVLNLVPAISKRLRDMNKYFTKDMLKGDQETEIKIELVEVMKDKYLDDSDWVFIIY